MTWDIFLGISALITFIVLICGPILKLSGNITKLNCSIEALIKSREIDAQRITKHGEEIDSLDKRVGECEGDIKNMKEKIHYFHDV